MAWQSARRIGNERKRGKRLNTV